MAFPEFREIVAGGRGGARVRAMQLGPLVYMPGLLPSVETGSTLRLQLESVLQHMRSVLAAAGGGVDDIARVTLYLREVRDRSVLNEVWHRWFPDPHHRPPHKYLPAVVPGGYAVMVDALGELSGGRRTLEITGVEHRDPMAMGARIGDLVFSSRLFAAEPTLQSQFALLVDHARVLMRNAGGDLDGLRQVTVFAPTPDMAAAMERLCADYWAAEQIRPVVHILVVDLGGTRMPRIEIIGVVPAARDNVAGR
jgi:enamine deaminase RidA (YjgF/YER057c/UK114 family)